MSRETLITDPHGLIMALDADAISARLAELDGQRMRRHENDTGRKGRTGTGEVDAR